MTDSASFHIPAEIAELVTGAYDAGSALLVAAVDAEGRPLLSVRGSVAVFSDTQLSFWARNAEGGTIAAIGANPNVALVYRGKTSPVLQFIGRARVAAPGAETDHAFSAAHPKEQAADPEKKGVAVIVDLDAIRGVLIGEGGRAFVNLTR